MKQLFLDSSNHVLVKTLFETIPPKSLDGILKETKLPTEDVFQLLAKKLEFHDILKYLLENDILEEKVKVSKDFDKKTLLYKVLQLNESTEIPLLLIKKGVSLDNIDGNGKHFFDVYFEQNSPKEWLLVEILENCPSDQFRRSIAGTGKNILHYATYLRDKIVLKFVSHDENEECLASVQDKSKKLPIQYMDISDSRFKLLFCRHANCWEKQLRILLGNETILDDLGT